MLSQDVIEVGSGEDSTSLSQSVTTNNDGSNVNTVTTTTATATRNNDSKFIQDVFAQRRFSICGVGLQYCQDAFNETVPDICRDCGKKIHKLCVGEVSAEGSKCTICCNGEYKLEPPNKPPGSFAEWIDKALVQLHTGKILLLYGRSQFDE